METRDDLCIAVHEKFPAIAARADAHYAFRFGNGETLTHLWFESLAHVVNDEMKRGTPAERHRGLFAFLAGRLDGCGPDVHACIDVAFVENLFHGVDRDIATPYWTTLPVPLKTLYLGFFGRPPL